MTDKRATLDEIVGQIESGMTIGIGGWGSRRKPMAVVRAILRSDVNDLTVVSYGGPDVGLLCAAGKVRKVVFGFVTLDRSRSIPISVQRAKLGTLRRGSSTKGCSISGFLRRLRESRSFLPRRSRLGCSCR